MLPCFLICRSTTTGFYIIHVEQENTVCPAFCKYDIVEWDFLDFDVEKVSIGDYVVLGGFRGPFYTTKILEGPAKDVCASGRIKAWRLPGDNRFCTKWKNDSGEYVHLYDFLIPGLPKPGYENIRGRDIAMIFRHEAKGVRPRKVGNLREYYLYSDEVTDLVGKALLTVYKWTGLNLFGLLEGSESKLDTN